MMLQLDLEVTDLDEAVSHALSLGAELPTINPRTTSESSSTPQGCGWLQC